MPTTWRDSFSNAVHYWEPRRIIYNVALTAVTIFWIAWTWPQFRPAMNFGDLLRLTGLALIANVLYCAAYLVDVPLQLSEFSASWTRRRLGLFLAGTAFAMLLTSYWLNDEVLPFVQ